MLEEERAVRAALFLVLLILAGGMAFIRLAPADPSRWHADALATPDPATPNFARIAPGDVVRPEPPMALARRIDAVMLAMPRTRRIAGAPAEGRMTYEARSRIFGFPDYISVRILPAGEGATFAALSRSRFGQSDLGVNAARLAALREAVAE